MSTFKDSSKQHWNNQQSLKNHYPGDMEVVIGCLQRIADASELTASNFLQLQKDVEMYKRLYNNEREGSKKLGRIIAGLRGSITKLKKSKQ